MKLTEQPAQHYLDQLQGLIDRLANNSSNCKNWCITLVSAILILAIDKSKPEALNLAYIPVLIFFLLDSYYLSVEREVREIYKNFVESPEENKLYRIKLNSNFCYKSGSLLKSMFWSFSTWPIYVPLALAITFTTCYVLKG